MQSNKIEVLDKMSEIENKESKLHLAKTTLNTNINKSDNEI